LTYKTLLRRASARDERLGTRLTAFLDDFLIGFPRQVFRRLPDGKSPAKVTLAALRNKRSPDRRDVYDYYLFKFEE